MKKFRAVLSYVILSASLSQAQIKAPHFKKVIYIVFENEDQRDVMSNTYYKSLAAQGVNFTNFTASIHPSQGNYIAMVAGDNYGINHDGNVDLNVPHLGDLLDTKNMSWKVYAQGYPGNCFTGSKKGKYARKHVPFLSFVNVTQNPTRCAQIQSDAHFFTDWKSNSLPDFAMYIPDLNNDGHDTSIDFSANWLQKNFDAAFHDSNLMKDTLVVLTYDESTYLGGNKIYNVFLGPMIKAGTENSTAHSHFSVLKMIEDEWSLGSLNRNDASALPMLGIWK